MVTELGTRDPIPKIPLYDLLTLYSAPIRQSFNNMTSLPSSDIICHKNVTNFHNSVTTVSQQCHKKTFWRTFDCCWVRSYLFCCLKKSFQQKNVINCKFPIWLILPKPKLKTHQISACHCDDSQSWWGHRKTGSLGFYLDKDPIGNDHIADELVVGNPE